MNNNLTVDGLVSIASRLSCYLMNFAVLLLIIFIVLAGIRFMMAGGNSEKRTKAIKNFQAVLIAGLVIFGVWVIINSVAGAVGSSYRVYIICSQ